MKYLGLWFFEKFVKPSGPSSYILNVRSLMQSLYTVRSERSCK